MRTQNKITTFVAKIEQQPMKIISRKEYAERIDDYPKYVISASPLLKRSDDEGVTHLHIREFLKNGL